MGENMSSIDYLPVYWPKLKGLAMHEMKTWPKSENTLLEQDFRFHLISSYTFLLDNRKALFEPSLPSPQTCTVFSMYVNQFQNSNIQLLQIQSVYLWNPTSFCTTSLRPQLSPSRLLLKCFPRQPPEIHGSVGFWTNGCGVKWLDVAWCGPKTWILYHTNIYIVLPTKNLDLPWTVPHQKIFESLPWVAHCTWSDHLPKLNFLGMQAPANQLG